MFTDRTHAGQILGEKLSHNRGKTGVVVGLARGGVVTAYALARVLSLPLDVLVVKKIGVPGQQELAVGALAPDGVFHVDWRFVQKLGVDEEYIQSQIPHLKTQIKQKTLRYRKGRKPYAFREKIVIIVDDGAATGSTVEVAIKWMRRKHAKKIIVALPVASKESIARVLPEADELVVLETPKEFGAVGQFYKNFEQVGDTEVVRLLAA